MGGPSPLDRKHDPEGYQRELQLRQQRQPSHHHQLSPQQQSSEQQEQARKESVIAMEWAAFSKGCKWFPTSPFSPTEAAYSSTLDSELKSQVAEYINASKGPNPTPKDPDAKWRIAFEKYGTVECSTGKERTVLTAIGLARLLSDAGYGGVLASVPAQSAFRVVKIEQATAELGNSNRSEPASAMTYEQFRAFFRDEMRAAK